MSHHSDEIVHRVTIEHARGYQFVASFDDLPDGGQILLDEPVPLGEGHGPSAAALLSAAVGNCLATSLLFCLNQTRARIDGLTARVTTRLSRNEAGRYRVADIQVELTPDLPPEELGRLGRCETLFEEFCIVTESVRRGIPVNVRVQQPASAPATV